MRKFTVAILFLLANFLFATVDYLPIDQVKIGMKGYVKTVFEGTQLTKVKFQVKEISASLFGSQEQPIIWVLAQTNLGQPVPASGQSGSPCWIYTSRGEKFLGLLAFGGLLDKSPIFGITPYEYIDKHLMRASEVSSGSQTKSLSLPIPINLGPLNQGLIRSDLERIFPQDRFMIMPTTSNQSNAVTFRQSKHVTLRPGSPINVYLTRGDLNLYAHGTVGMVDGKSFIAFGHAFNNFGECELPVYPARVGATVESYYSSYRIPGPDIGPLIGTITMDSNCGIKGEIGRQPNMVAVSFGFQAKNFSQKRNFEIIKANITPDYLALISKYYLSHFASESGLIVMDRGMLRIKTTYSFKNNKAPYIQTQVYNFLGNYGTIASQYVIFLYARILMPIFSNKTMLADLNQIDFEVDVLPDWQSLIAEKIEVKGKIESGKEIAVNLSFLSVDEMTRYMAKLKVKCPDGIEMGRGTLEVKTGMNYVMSPREFKSLPDYLKIQSNSVIFVRLVYYKVDPLMMLFAVIQGLEKCIKSALMIGQESDSNSLWIVEELVPFQKMELWYELKAPIMTNIDVNKIFGVNYTQGQEKEAKNSKKK